MWAYLSHYVFIVIAANLIIIPLKPSFVTTIVILYSFSVLCIVITYYILYVLILGKAQKKQQQN